MNSTYLLCKHVISKKLRSLFGSGDHVAFYTVILYVYMYTGYLNSAWHIFHVVSRRWKNYLRSEHNLSYLEIICTRRTGTRNERMIRQN